MENQQLLEASPKEIRKLRGKDISIMFQETMTSLNPVFGIGTTGNQIRE
ncbi:hypothetical protein [Paenibacillus radicis (ex Xue et al. 2023)]|uniref:Uncharacterized protein n=1 Tax=Paenibacillus radicis (ex Xue et al. 2023) TaxID=2972489 RepID=A0ABT1YLK1_9BACL|nr:hypothetical protein [Paenibacillus radicis (ex Xue et al. 2023)]MCR8633148.1 hypothetical protein [Paenibacillus radicis (ex Xue et al. 2023)]